MKKKQKNFKQTAFVVSAFFGGAVLGFGAHQEFSGKDYHSSEKNAYYAAVQQESIAKGSLPTTSYTITRDGYSLTYDPRTRNPIYVYEKLSSSSLVGRVSRDKFQFKEDKSIPDIFRSTVKDYLKSGYDRGHLAPAADHKNSHEAMANTFFMSNMSPQVPQFNRGYWAQLEKHVRDLTREYKSIEVFTGPLYLPNEDRMVSYPVIGENDVAVPTHFYKVLFLKNASDHIETRAYILPNTNIAPETSLDKFATSLQKVEKASGVLFRELR